MTDPIRSKGYREPGFRVRLDGWVSTLDYEDAVTTRRWQRDNAGELIAGRGWIVDEFFDQRCSDGLKAAA